ncbi:MAG: sel1 repeat family protein [Akkermansia sp.]|nr:sel1 repeat family protein [Akkermansia sp.]
MSSKVFKVNKSMGELTYIGDSQERVYVKIPVNKVENAPRRKCKFVGSQKSWKTNAKTLTRILNEKRKLPIYFCDEGPCWTFYFDEAEGALYNEVNDEIPILKLEYMPQQELNHNVDKEDKSICVQPLVRKDVLERERQEKEPKMKKHATQPAKCSQKNTAGATAAGSVTTQEQEIKKALDEMKKKAKCGEPDFMYGLGMYYVNKGIKWLKRAAKKSHQQAKEQLKRWENEAGGDMREGETPDSADKKAVTELTYEQIAEQVERLQPIFQYCLAKLCLEEASARGHQHAKRLIGLWGAKEIEPENVAARCMVWGRDVLPLEVNDTHESGHEVVTDALSQSVHLVSERVEEKRSWWVCLVEKWKKWIRW